MQGQMPPLRNLVNLNAVGRGYASRTILADVTLAAGGAAALSGMPLIAR